MTMGWVIAPVLSIRTVSIIISKQGIDPLRSSFGSSVLLFPLQAANLKVHARRSGQKTVLTL